MYCALFINYPDGFNVTSREKKKPEVKAKSRFSLLFPRVSCTVTGK